MTAMEKVSDATRRDARKPVALTWEQLNKERDQLTNEKRTIEAELAQLSSNKRTELARVYRGRKGNITYGTCEVAARYDNRRCELLSKKKAIEDRLSQVRAKLGAPGKNNKPPTENTEALFRIERLLAEILNLLKANLS